MQRMSRTFASRATLPAPILVATPQAYDWSIAYYLGLAASFGPWHCRKPLA